LAVSLLIPADVVHPRRPDAHYLDEARAAGEAGLSSRWSTMTRCPAPGE
jgi:hypothetical protein